MTEEHPEITLDDDERARVLARLRRDYAERRPCQSERHG